MLLAKDLFQCLLQQCKADISCVIVIVIVIVITLMSTSLMLRTPYTESRLKSSVQRTNMILKWLLLN